MSQPPIRIGTAGWSIASRHAGAFVAQGTHLQRYARRLCCVEINSSFHRPHRRETYERWAASTPAGFRFSVKLPKAITHEARFRDCDPLLERFLSEIAGLGDRLGAILVQTPPSLPFDAGAERFLAAIAGRSPAPLAIEPRHAGWYAPEATALMAQLDIARVAADPSRIPGDDEPVGRRLAYFRFHGSPRIYFSDYDQDRLARIADVLLAARREGKAVWCIFDNTAASHALRNALDVDALLGRRSALPLGSR